MGVCEDGLGSVGMSVFLLSRRRLFGMRWAKARKETLGEMGDDAL